MSITGHCDGWELLDHDTDEPLVEVEIVGCIYCRGVECGATDWTVVLCPQCLEDLRADCDENEYTILGEAAVTQD